VRDTYSVGKDRKNDDENIKILIIYPRCQPLRHGYKKRDRRGLATTKQKYKKIRSHSPYTPTRDEHPKSLVTSTLQLRSLVHAVSFSMWQYSNRRLSMHYPHDYIITKTSPTKTSVLLNTQHSHQSTT